MADELVMPKLGLTMEAGKIVSWLVDEGSEVSPGQPILVIETDKVESEVEAPAAGLLHQTGVVGEEYPCGAGIGWFLAPGEAPPEPRVEAQAGGKGPLRGVNLEALAQPPRLEGDLLDGPAREGPRLAEIDREAPLPLLPPGAVEGGAVDRVGREVHGERVAPALEAEAAHDSGDMSVI